jgi:ribosomal protein S25
MTPQALIEKAAASFFAPPDAVHTPQVKRLAEPVVAKMMMAVPPARDRSAVQALDEDDPRVKLPISKVKAAIASGEAVTAKQLAQKFGVTISCVRHACDRHGIKLAYNADTPAKRRARARYEACKRMAASGAVINCTTLAPHFGVSVSIMHETFRKIEAEGITVNRWNVQARRDALAKVAQNPGFSVSEYAEKTGLSRNVINADLRKLGMPIGRGRQT